VAAASAAADESGGCFTVMTSRVPDPHGDITMTCSGDRQGVIQVIAQTRAFDDPTTSPAWKFGNTFIGWLFGPSPTAPASFGAFLSSDPSGVATIDVVDATGKTLCSATPEFDAAGQLYAGSFPASCIGSPASYYWGTVLVYDKADGTRPSQVEVPPVGPIVARLFSSFQNLGCCTSGSPRSASWAPGRTDLFIRGTDGALYHKWSVNGHWSGWENLGGQLASDPAVVSPAQGRLAVFVRGIDNALYEKTYAGGWSGWVGIGGTVVAAPAATTWGPNRIDVFVRGSDNALWHKWQNGAQWSGWERLGGILASGPSAVAWANERIDVVVQGTDHAVWHTFFAGGWSGWDSLGGQIAGDPAVTSWGPGRLDVFVEGASDNNLYHALYAGGWSGYENLFGQLKSGPGASSPGPGHLEVYVQGTDDSVYTTVFP
jgi:hypothetical protein